MSIEIASLRAQLASQLVVDLGLYTTPTGGTIAAIYVVNNIDLDPPRDWKVRGVECLISRCVDRAPLACFQGVADRYQVEVNLVQHDRDRDLNNAIEVLFSHWQRIRIGWHRSQTEEELEQIKLYLPSQQYFKIS